MSKVESKGNNARNARFAQSGPSEIEVAIDKGNDKMVVHPDHYAVGKYECIDVMQDLMSRKIDILKEGTYHWGSAFKYIWRAGEKPADTADTKSAKEKTVQDLKKAIVYLNWCIDSINGEKLRK